MIEPDGQVWRNLVTEEVSKVADYPNQSPRGGNQFFGHAAIAENGVMTVSLRDLGGATLWSRTLEPQHSRR